LGKFKKRDLERIKKDVFTFARSHVEVDLGKGLLDHIIKNKKIKKIRGPKHWTTRIRHSNAISAFKQDIH